MLELKTDEALLHVQIAELFLSAQMPDGAEKLFERAIHLAPDESQYREYFGDFLFQQNRRDEAFAIWDAIAQGNSATRKVSCDLQKSINTSKRSKRAPTLQPKPVRLAPKDPIVFIRSAKILSKAQAL